MSFLLRSTQRVAVERSPANDSISDVQYASKSGPTLGGLMAEDPIPNITYENYDGHSDELGLENYITEDLDAGNPVEVTEGEGWITIPYKELPDNWSNAQDINSLRSLDRSFVFPGEHICILACLTANKEDTELITPFKVAAAMGRNNQGQMSEKQNGNVNRRTTSVSNTYQLSPDRQEKDGENLSREIINQQKDTSDSESLVRRESRKRQIENLLQRFKNSHFIVRIAESGEQLWSKGKSVDMSSGSSEMDDQQFTENRIRKSPKDVSCTSSVMDRGNFDANASGGIARDSVQCFSLSSGDIVVLLQVNIAVESLKDPMLEILQFEKCNARKPSSQCQENIAHSDQDPSTELLKWLLPLDKTLPPISRPLPPTLPSLDYGAGSASRKAYNSTSSSSQLFSFGHLRSYSMSSLPQSTGNLSQPVKVASSIPKFEIEDWEQFSSQNSFKNNKSGSESLLSFRGVPLEQKRFSMRCGLEGMYVPGRWWRRKLEIVQPVKIHSFAANCNTDDLLCVQIKNVSPVHLPDIVIYIDSITIIVEKASEVGPPPMLPIACIEAGGDDNLPNLALRRGEEHSFILKPIPATSSSRSIKVNGERSLHTALVQAANVLADADAAEGKSDASTGHQYAIMVSCRCNYTDSRLFFKQTTSWLPRAPRDLMISVASEMSRLSPELNGSVSGLPAQVLTLRATNLTSEDLTLTILAPDSFVAPPSLVSFNSSPSTPISPFVGCSGIQGRVNEKCGGASSVHEKTSATSNVISSNGLVCTHLWLQSRVPLGCVPSQSTATVKLELLPLTDGIIPLDTLQIDIKEKGCTYVPEHSLKIYATSSISTGIM